MRLLRNNHPQSTTDDENNTERECCKRERFLLRLVTVVTIYGVLHSFISNNFPSYGTPTSTARQPSSNGAVAVLSEQTQQQHALPKGGSSLRFDWTNLPPLSPLARIIEQSQSQCLNASAVKEFGPQKIVHFDLVPSGMGSALHTWMNPLCYAAENNHVLLTGDMPWIWNDESVCNEELSRKHDFRPSDWSLPGSGSWRVPEISALWCYFGWHESAMRCPPATLAFNESAIDLGRYFNYRCDRLRKEHGGWEGVHSAVAEWLFQNVSHLVIERAERQIREEAFPITNETGTTTTGTSTENPPGETFQRWPGLPDADSLITVHIRWGDKASEMKLTSIEEVFNATKRILTPDELAGNKLVHIYVASEDPEALEKFRLISAPMNWQIHSSGPTNPEKGAFNMLAAAKQSRGYAGIESLAALLVSLEANRYVLARGSNWSRLIDELRKSIVDSRCGKCTQMIDLRPHPGMW